MTPRFADKLADAIDRAGTPLCVGLDPVLERLPDGIDRRDASAALDSFCAGVIDAVAGVVPAVKPQSACFERHGSAGVAALERVIGRAREAGLVVLLDVKRGDIGPTARHYAAAAAGLGADAVTVNPYMGTPAVEASLEAGLGVFALVRTSNPEGDAVQSLLLERGGSVADRVASLVAGVGRRAIGGRGLSDVGAVVGATRAGEGPTLRGRMPDQVFLVPGLGAQGGSARDVRSMIRPGARRPGEMGVLASSSRSVIYAWEEGAGGREWIDAVRSAADRAAADVRDALLDPDR